jgi:CO/xanthine dehydrogenase Mo-binding subunit
VTAGRDPWEDASRAKVTGAFGFGADEVTNRPAAYRLHAVRATQAPATIRGFDAPDGRLITATDIAGDPLTGPAVRDEPVLPRDRVSYVGQVLALLAVAGDREPGRVTVAYGRPEGEIAEPITLSRARGDVDAALGRAAYVVDGTYDFPSQRHYHLDTDAGWADFDGHRLHVVAPTQAPYELRAALSAVTTVPEARITIDAVHLGGAFGSRLEQLFPCQLAVAAVALESSVTGTVSPRDRIRFGVRGHAVTMRLRTAASATGEILAAVADLELDQGAFVSYSPVVLRRMLAHVGAPYRTAAVRAEGRIVHSHRPPAAAFRGFGVPQLTIAVEHQMDALAERLGADPFEFRIENAVAGLAPSIRRCRDLVGAAGPSMGVAPFVFGVGNTAKSNPARVVLTDRGDGEYELWATVVDYGQGAHRALHRMVRQALGDPDAIVHLRTDLGPAAADAGKTSASRTVHFVGCAIEDAVRRLRALRAAEPHSVPLVACGEYDPHLHLGDEPYPAWSYGCYAADVERDAATGGARVIRVIAVHDVGPVVDADAATGQVHGGIAMAAGYVLFEAVDPAAELAPRLPITGAPDLLAPVVDFIERSGGTAADRAGLGEPAGLGAPAALHSALRRAGPPTGLFPGDSFVRECTLTRLVGSGDAEALVVAGGVPDPSVRGL